MLGAQAKKGAYSRVILKRLI